MRGTRRSSKAPQFPIAPILEELGLENVPHLIGEKRYGKVRCIWHPDTKPSAHVSQYGFICFACGKEGDAIKLIREEEGLNFEAAVKRCQELTGNEDRGGAPERDWGESLLG